MTYRHTGDAKLNMIQLDQKRNISGLQAKVETLSKQQLGEAISLPLLASTPVTVDGAGRGLLVVSSSAHATFVIVAGASGYSIEASANTNVTVIPL